MPEQQTQNQKPENQKLLAKANSPAFLAWNTQKKRKKRNAIEGVVSPETDPQIQMLTESGVVLTTEDNTELTTEVA